jgi:ribosomal protein L11 methyltransferase
VPFLELTFESNAVNAEALESACFAAGALSVTLTDAADEPIFEPELHTAPLWPEVRISVLFAADANPREILNAIADVPPEHTFIEIEDRAWEREWLVDFKPMRFGGRLWICPHEQHVSDENAVVVRLDPGLAFGTGTHPTTAMCLQWLDGAELNGKQVIDYGCGSGILALAAVKLGARRVFAVDHDPQALLATRENAERNSVERQVQTLQPEASLASADVLLANILAGPLIEFALLFQTLVRPGGHVVLSGILADQADAVSAAYSPWFQMDDPTTRNEWTRLHGVRR